MPPLPSFYLDCHDSGQFAVVFYDQAVFEYLIPVLYKDAQIESVVHET